MEGAAVVSCMCCCLSISAAAAAVAYHAYTQEFDKKYEAKILTDRRVDYDKRDITVAFGGVGENARYAFFQVTPEEALEIGAGLHIEYQSRVKNDKDARSRFRFKATDRTVENHPQPGKTIPTWLLMQAPLKYQKVFTGPHQFVQLSDTGTDIGDAVSGTLQACKSSCDTTPGCIGFSRLKSANDDDAASCWMKKKFVTLTPNTEYQTFTSDLELVPASGIST